MLSLVHSFLSSMPRLTSRINRNDVLSLRLVRSDGHVELEFAVVKPRKHS